MKLKPNRNSAITLDGAHRAKHVPLSSMLRVDEEKMEVFVKKHVRQRGESPWLNLGIGVGRLPATGLHKKPSTISTNPHFFWAIVASVDTYLLRQKPSKSMHIKVSDVARSLVKACEYCFVKGYYALEDVPAEEWERLRNALSTGGWVEALEVRQRAAIAFASIENLDQFQKSGHVPGRIWSLKTSFLAILGTNIAARELAWIKDLMVQAIESPAKAASGSLESYELVPLHRPSKSMLLQELRQVNSLADAPQPWGLSQEPIPEAFKYAEKHGAEMGRTENFGPDQLATILVESYKWVLEYGPKIVDFITVLSVQLSALYGADAKASFGRNTMTKGSWNEWVSVAGRQVLASLSEREALEHLLGKKITTYRERRSGTDTISVNAVLNMYYSAAFSILATMNARRKDEISHKAIGLHSESLKVVDPNLKIYAAEFYVEKTYKDYLPFFINDISRVILEQLSQLAEIAWGWEELLRPGIDWSGRDRKLFVHPRFASSVKVVPTSFDFNVSTNGQAVEFLAMVMGNDGAEVTARGHMFRRAYGLIFHYRFENATLVALSQKYGHIDPLMVLTYITDGVKTPLGKRIAALWSAPTEVVSRAQQELSQELVAEIKSVGADKLKEYIQQIIEGSATLGGGFGRLLGRFHSRLKGRVDYSKADSKTQADRLAGAMTNRGHYPTPLVHVTCFAGDLRRGAACSDSAGNVARHRANAAVCSGCPYSTFGMGHMATLKAQAAALEMQAIQGGPWSARRAVELGELKRVIALQSERLGVQ